MASQRRCIKCLYCSDEFTNHLYLVLHSEIRHPNQPIEGVQISDLQCDRCLIEFDTPEKLEEHFNNDHPIEVKVDEASITPEESLDCKVCRRTFRARHLLKRHLQRSTCKDEFCIPMQVGEFPFYCDICGHGFPYKFRLIHHMSQRHTGKEHKCKYCNQRYVLEASLRKHERYECVQRPDLADDQITKLGIKKVSSDDKKTWGGYREPKNAVQGAKTFDCSFCDKVYDTHYKLKQHLLSHANLREFKCSQCDCAYNTKPRLRRHYIYNHTDHPTFDCEVCGWKFREKNNLKRHMRLHNGDYQAQCQICQKKFTANCHLKYHMNTAHSSETPYQVKTRWLNTEKKIQSINFCHGIYSVIFVENRSIQLAKWMRTDDGTLKRVCLVIFAVKSLVAEIVCTHTKRLIPRNDAWCARCVAKTLKPLWCCDNTCICTREKFSRVTFVQWHSLNRPVVELTKSYGIIFCNGSLTMNKKYAKRNRSIVLCISLNWSIVHAITLTQWSF